MEQGTRTTKHKKDNAPEMKKAIPYIVFIILLCWHAVLYAQDRFPRPEFESGYTYPTNQMPLQRGIAWEYIDVAVLIAALSVASWLALKKRSRQGLLWLSVFHLHTSVSTGRVVSVQ